MENQVDEKTPEVTPRPRLEKWVSKGAPSYWRKQLLEELKKEHDESQSDLQYAALVTNLADAGGPTGNAPGSKAAAGVSKAARSR